MPELNTPPPRDHFSGLIKKSEKMQVWSGLGFRVLRDNIIH